MSTVLTANSSGSVKCGYSVIRQPGTVVDFLFKVQDKIFDERNYVTLITAAQ